MRCLATRLAFATAAARGAGSVETLRIAVSGASQGELADFVGLLARRCCGAERAGIELFSTLWGVLRRLFHEWTWQAHGGQQGPEDAATDAAAEPEWRTWLIMAGRGFGKTLAGAQWVTARARENPGARIALVGETHAEVVRTMSKDGGAAAQSTAGRAAAWEPTRRILGLASGASFPIRAAAEALRGPEHDFACATAGEMEPSTRQERARATPPGTISRWGEARTRQRAIVTTTPRGSFAAGVRGLEGR